jgi:hypothetical protein
MILREIVAVILLVFLAVILVLAVIDGVPTDPDWGRDDDD